MDLTLRSTRHHPPSTDPQGVLTPLLKSTIARLGWEKDALGLSTSPNISDATEQYDVLTQLTDEMVKAVETFRSGWDSVCKNPELASDWYAAHAITPSTLAAMLDFTKMTADSLGRDGKTSGEDEDFDRVSRSREERYLERTLSILGRKFPQYLKGESETGMSIMNLSSVADRNEAKSRQRAMKRATLSTLPRMLPILQDELLTYLREIKARRSDAEAKRTELHHRQPTSSHSPTLAEWKSSVSELREAKAVWMWLTRELSRGGWADQPVEFGESVMSMSLEKAIRRDQIVVTPEWDSVIDTVRQINAKSIAKARSDLNLDGLEIAARFDERLRSIQVAKGPAS